MFQYLDLLGTLRIPDAIPEMMCYRNRKRYLLMLRSRKAGSI